MIFKFFMKYILLFIAVLILSCKYNVSSPVGTIKDYSANSGKLYYVSSQATVSDIELALRKNKHSLGKYKIVVENGDSNATILTNIKKALDNNPSFDNVEVDLSLLKITEIPKDMFTNTFNLASITLPDSVTKIDENAFSNCSSLNNIRFSSNLTNICQNAFSSCSALSLLILSDSLTTIGNSAFSNCSSLKNLFLPASLTSIETGAFSNCTNLVNLEYLGATNSLSNSSNNVFSSTSYPTNLYLPAVTNDSQKNNFTNFLGKSWSSSNIYTNKHIPS